MITKLQKIIVIGLNNDLRTQQTYLLVLYLYVNAKSIKSYTELSSNENKCKYVFKIT